MASLLEISSSKVTSSSWPVDDALLCCCSHLPLYYAFGLHPPEAQSPSRLHQVRVKSEDSQLDPGNRRELLAYLAL
ncbi:hypothetical protein RJ641_011191 [Dillenia turbinata]|uniref:Uncharacterized protein n=1 Tax=Dillenia turbinata TaxID=194707 RepID=A0AAN8V943_9MAGN